MRSSICPLFLRYTLSISYAKSFQKSGLEIIHQNPTKDHVTFSRFIVRFPPFLRHSLQNAIIFFSIWLCWVWKSMLDKSIHFMAVFQKNFWFCLFPTILLTVNRNQNSIDNFLSTQKWIFYHLKRLFRKFRRIKR